MLGSADRFYGLWDYGKFYRGGLCLQSDMNSNSHAKTYSFNLSALESNLTDTRSYYRFYYFCNAQSLSDSKRVNMGIDLVMRFHSFTQAALNI